MIEIPLNSSFKQEFNIVLSGINYDIYIALNSRLEIWTIDFSIAGAYVVRGVPLLSGIDILKQHQIEIKNLFILNIDEPELDIDKVGLGTDSKLLQIEDEDIAELELEAEDDNPI